MTRTWRTWELEEARQAHADLADASALVLTWRSNGRHPMADMTQRWLLLGLVTDAQRLATAGARLREVEAFLADARANALPPSAEERAEARAAHGAGVAMVNVVTGQRWTT